jgi:hypothetical protein
MDMYHFNPRKDEGTEQRRQNFIGRVTYIHTREWHKPKKRYGLYIELEEED